MVAGLEASLSLPAPYYEDEAVTIYNADCREVLPELERESVDLVLTDPPYGIGKRWVGGESANHGWARAAKDKDWRNAWDAEPADIEPLLSLGHEQIIWGGNHFSLPASRGWLVWVKPERGFTLSEAEVAWTSRDTVMRVISAPRSDYGREHPTQKPLQVMQWCLRQPWTVDMQMILDPFMGSGTTLLAAKNLNRKAIGIEVNEAYCALAVQRLAQGVLPLETG